MRITAKNPVSLLPFLDCGTAGVDRDTGKLALYFTIITTRPNGLMEPIHDRMRGIYDDINGHSILQGSDLRHLSSARLCRSAEKNCRGRSERRQSTESGNCLLPRAAAYRRSLREMADDSGFVIYRP